MTETSQRFQGGAGVALGHAIVDDLGGHALSTTPANYEVLAAYKTGSHPSLTQDLNARLAAEGKLSEEACADLFDRHFARTRLSAQFVEASAEVAREIADVTATLREAGALAGSYAGELQGAASGLEAADPATLRTTIARLARATKEMATQNRQLEDRMQASSRQLDSLQTTLQDIRLQAVTDALTGIANRRHFDEVLQAEIAKSQKTGDSLCLVLADIDHFKRVNDTWGHQVGDQVIRYVASVFRSQAEGGLPARYGGEEFALILRATPLTSAIGIAERIRATIKAKRLSRRTTGEMIGVVTISLGAAQYRLGETAAQFLERADACLYRSKRNGRDRTTGDTQMAAVA